MPVTPIYGFPFEDADDQPGKTLTGGEFGTDAILAEVIEDEFTRVDSDVEAIGTSVAGIDERVTNLEDILGWQRIDEGVTSGPAFSIDVTKGGLYPAGTFSRMRLGLRGYMADAGIGTVRLRINGDTALGHRTAARAVEPNGTTREAAQSDSANQWILAYWASTVANTCTTNIYITDVSALVAYDSQCGRMSAGAGMWQVHSWGRLENSTIVTSLDVRPFSDTTNEFGGMRWWLEGDRS